MYTCRTRAALLVHVLGYSLFMFGCDEATLYKCNCVASPLRRDVYPACNACQGCEIDHIKIKINAVPQSQTKSTTPITTATTSTQLGWQDQ